MCLMEVSLAAAISFAAAARTSSMGEGESWEELEGDAAARELAFISASLPASRALSKTAVTTLANRACIFVWGTFLV